MSRAEFSLSKVDFHQLNLMLKGVFLSGKKGAQFPFMLQVLLTPDIPLHSVQPMPEISWISLNIQSAVDLLYALLTVYSPGARTLVNLSLCLGNNFFIHSAEEIRCIFDDI